MSNAFLETPSEVQVPFLEQHAFLAIEQHSFLDASHSFLGWSANVAEPIANAAMVRVRMTFFICFIV